MTDAVGTYKRADRTILIVEDSDAIRRAVCSILGGSGYTCLEACNGAEALTILRARGEIELVLTDVVMPEMGGAELAGYLACEYPYIPLLFMSGYTDDPLVRAIKQTAAAFIAKPFTAATLTATVRRVLAQPSEFGDRHRGSDSQ